MFWNRAREKKIRIVEDGPYRVEGGIPLREEVIAVDASGAPATWQPGRELPQGRSYDLCRCGQSQYKPYCDGHHELVGFRGGETASREPYAAQAETIKGPALTLTDAPKLCAHARFCTHGQGTWNLIRRSDTETNKAEAIRQAGICPSGRLVAREPDGAVHEPDLEPSISVTEDPSRSVSGPIWVKGSVPIESSDGTLLETRNRVTLCRCGQSKNMPYCDGTHLSVKFKA